MIQLNSDDMVYFLHIRRTGGTTLLTPLMNNFHNNSILNLWDWNRLLADMPIDFSKYQFIHGHFGYGVCRFLPNKPLFITMLREPIDQAVSNFNHNKREPREKIRKIYHGITFDDILAHSPEGLTYVNPQLCEIVNDQIEKFLDTRQDGNIDDIYESSTKEEFLAIAIERLKEFAFVGLLERYQESLFLLAYTFGWTPVKNILATNTTVKPFIKKDQISESTLKKIQELTTLDKKLYQFGKQLFEHRYNTMVQELKAKYYKSSFDELANLEAVYEMLQLWYSDIYEKKHPVMLDTISFDFSDVLNGWGWQVREENPQNKKIFRWTGPETRSIIDLPLKRDHDLEISILVIGSMTQEILDSFRLKINTESNVIALTKQRQPNSEGMLFTGVIPQNFLQSKYSFTRFIFEVNKTVTPKSANPSSDDERPLGIAVKDIVINPII